MPAPVWGFAAAAYLPPAPEPYWEGINVAVIVNALRGYRGVVTGERGIEAPDGVVDGVVKFGPHNQPTPDHPELPLSGV